MGHKQIFGDEDMVEGKRGYFKIGSLRSPGGQKHMFLFLTTAQHSMIWLFMTDDKRDSGTAVFGLTRSLEIWMGENLLTPFTEGTSLLNRALEAEENN